LSRRLFAVLLITARLQAFGSRTAGLFCVTCGTIADYGSDLGFI
jgi:hypothetical protein